MPTDQRICEDMLVPKLVMLPRLATGFRWCLVVVLLVFSDWCRAHFTTLQFSPLDCDVSDPSCGWAWSDGFLLLSAENTTALGTTAPDADSEGNVKGQFLYYSATDAGLEETMEVVTPMFDPFTLPTCQLEMTLHMFNMEQAVFKVIMKAPNSTWESNIFNGDNAHTWRIHKQMIGAVRQPFNVILEVIVQSSAFPSHLAIDSIEAVDCYMKTSENTECVKRQFQCSDLICIDDSKVCDANSDCIYGEDESQECDKLPESAFCTFETNMCGWNSSSKQGSEWVRHRGESPNQRTGPSFDHTLQNATGTYMLAKFPSGRSFGMHTVFTSPWFSPPPVYHRNIHSQFYNTCQVRFFFHKYGDRMGELRLDSLEHDPGSHVPRIAHLWRSYGNKGNIWWPAVVTLPQISHRYQLQFIASRGMDHSDIAIDDVTLSRECFNIGVPLNESIELPGKSGTNKPDAPDSQNPNGKRYTFSACGAKGRVGPNDTLCHFAYLNTSTKVTVVNEPTMEGVQKWTVPSDGLYTIFVRGAGGGSGVHRDKEDRSLGAYLRATFDWEKDDVIYLLIGQKGRDACASDNTFFLHRMCETIEKRDINTIRDMNRKRNEGGGGGGGGATYVFKIDPETNLKVPMAIAGGGGGLSAGLLDDNSLANFVPHGMGPNNSIAPINGYTGSGAGGGGGWDDTTSHNSSGQSLREGGRGGEVCLRASVWVTDGGFGGGGGGCASGGGGGGYRGGDASPNEGPYYNGQGGTSYLMPGAIRALIEPGSNEGDGSVIIIPAQKGCGCDYMCVMLDLESKAYYCICPSHLTINIDGFSCNGHESGLSSTMLAVIILSVVIVLSVGTICIICISARFRKLHIPHDVSHEPLNNPEVQLRSLRNAGGMITEYNPNYEFGGSTCTAQDLREVPREQLTLVKALGQGAFGEVYQGYLTNPNSENSERPVAVKTLPELSSSQAEMDFLMEALIMSKFNHPNIVSFIGVCFEKLPRFIVLELLPGGDLKSFLRECRPKPSKESELTVSDLLKLAMDVAKGCQYLEENHFVHRDIAARNCLLTTKEASRVVKIADFGMARDIYGADYYRKGGKAMLPVKWMPPEAFLDGIFTSKTDVWSFGVLLWEVISLGYMPYPGRGNQEVMQLVTAGGRLEPPTNCPSPVYHIMMQCWHPHSDERPNFTTIIERLGYCLQDPDVINAPLPVFNRAPSMEKDTTVMRPLDDDSNGCLQVQRPDPGLLLSPGSEDYLIPMPQSSYSMTSERTDLQSSPSLGSSDQLLEMEERGSTPSATRPEVWETKFMTPDATKPPLKKQGGYTQIPTEDTDHPEPAEEPPQDIPERSPQKNGPLVANGPKKTSAARLSSIKSLDDLPLAPVANENVANNKANAVKNQSNLSLDAGALVRQMANPASTENPNRYVNVDVNCNTGGSNSSLSALDRSAGLANRNPTVVSGPFDGYAGVNPVA